MTYYLTVTCVLKNGANKKYWFKILKVGGYDEFICLYFFMLFMLAYTTNIRLGNDPGQPAFLHQVKYR